jgi:probable rRNA maturation factor
MRSGWPRAAPGGQPTGPGDSRVSIEIANESGTAVDEAALAAIARHVLDGMRVHPLAELSVLLVDEPAMAELHERWLGEPGPTDVLAFPMDELRPPHQAGARADRGTAAETGPIPGLLGDVVLCPQVAAEQAAKAGHAVHAELELLCTHGILHLLGYDHADPGEHAEMFGLQDKLLAAWRAGRESDDPVGPDAAAGPAGADVADVPAGPDVPAGEEGSG